MVILFGIPLPSFPCEVSRNEVSTRWRLVDQATYFDLPHRRRRSVAMKNRLVYVHS